jgi:hypothetical protein
MRRLLFVLPSIATLGLLGACATAAREQPEVGGRPDGGPMGSNKDGGMVVLVDAAPLPDAPPGQQTKTLSQTNNNTIAAGASVACGTSAFGIPLGTNDNSWYRVFKLSDYGVNTAFQVQRVTFMTDYAYAGSGTTQPATVKVGTYAGTVEANTLTTGQITHLASAPTTIPDADATNATPAPVVTDIAATIPAGSNLVVEISLPDGVDDGNFFYIGVSAGGETKKGYIRATPSGCGFTTPSSLVGQLGHPDNAVLLTVTGTY